MKGFNIKRIERGLKKIWGYLCKVSDYFTYFLMDMDKVILFLDKDNYVNSYEHTGNFYPEDKEDKEVVGLMDENAEIEPIKEIFF